MSRSLFAAAVVLPLALLALAAFPIFPHEAPASVELSPPQEAPEEPELLGESGAMLAEPAAPREISGRPAAGPAAGTMTLSVPKLGIKDLPVPDGSTQAELDQEGIINLDAGGPPGQKGSNTFIVGHTLGFQHTAVPYVFYELESLRPGDKIVIENNTGRHVYRVYDHMTLRPQDYWATYPVEGKTVVSLQGCTPIPTFEYRLVVRGELVES